MLQGRFSLGWPGNSLYLFFFFGCLFPVPKMPILAFSVQDYSVEHFWAFSFGTPFTVAPFCSNKGDPMGFLCMVSGTVVIKYGCIGTP